jgi:hypothetical protein
VQFAPPLAHAGLATIQTSSVIPDTIVALVRLATMATESHIVIIFRSFHKTWRQGAVTVALSMALREVEVDVGWEDRARDRLAWPPYAMTCTGISPVGAENPCHLGRCSCRARSRVRCRVNRSWPVRTCDDLRLVGLKLIFLAVSSAISLLRLSRQEER